MKLQALFMCRAADVEGGLLYILGGGIDSMTAAMFPVGIGASAVIMLEMTHEEYARPRNSVLLTLHALNDEEAEVARIEGAVESSEDFPADPKISPTVKIALPLHALVVTDAGYYSLRVAVDDQALGQIAFRVKQADAVPASLTEATA